MADGAKDEKVKQAQLQTLRLVANDYWKTSGKLGASDAALWKVIEVRRALHAA